MAPKTYTTDNYTYTCDTIAVPVEYDAVASVTIGERTFNRAQLLNILSTETPHNIEYPFLRKDIDKIITFICFAQLNGAL